MKFLIFGLFHGSSVFLLYLARSEISGPWQKKTLDGRHQLLIREKRSDPTLTTLSSPGPLLLERERENLLKYIILWSKFSIFTEVLKLFL